MDETGRECGGRRGGPDDGLFGAFVPDRAADCIRAREQCGSGPVPDLVSHPGLTVELECADSYSDGRTE